MSSRRRQLEAQPAEQRGPLWGVPFGVKDNIDVAGHPTTAACPSFACTPERHAAAVQPLFDAGGIFLGKTNLDQFACGLVGTRTPHAIPGAPTGSCRRGGGGGSLQQDALQHHNAVLLIKS